MKSKIERYLTKELGRVGIQPPSEFVEFWSENYGQEVDVLISDVHGKTWNVDRILHLERRDEIADQAVSLLSGGLEQLDYSVEYLESMFPNWQDHDKIFPFAGINTKHAGGVYNLVTLDYMVSREPRVSIWIHEESFGYEEPFLIMVSPNIKHFIRHWKNT